MAFDIEKEISKKKDDREDSFVKKVMRKVSPQEKRARKKKARIKSFLQENFHAIAKRAASLMDFLARGQETLKELIKEGLGVDKAIDEHKGLYMSEKLRYFKKAQDMTEKEIRSLDSLMHVMHRPLKRDVQTDSAAHHYRSYYTGEVTETYTRLARVIHPVILLPKSELKAPEKDHSGKGVSRVAALLLAGLQLANTYQTTTNQMERMNLDITEASAFSHVGGPAIERPSPKSVVIKKSLEELKKEADERKESLDGTKEEIKWVGERLEKRTKKMELRIAYDVPVKMERTREGERIRAMFAVKAPVKQFNFGGFNVRYT